MRYYWMRLKTDFFQERRVRALRRSPNGETLVLRYLELLLASLETEGELRLYQLGSPAEEVALLLDCETEEAKTLLESLSRLDLMRPLPAGALFFPAAAELTGSESAGAARMRKNREKREEPAPASPNEASASHCDSPVSHCDKPVSHCDTEIEIEKETEKETEQDTEKDTQTEGYTDSDPSSAAPQEAAPVLLPAAQKKTYTVNAEKMKELASLFPELDIPAELRAMRGWLQANPDRLKAASGMPRFINGWLTRSKSSLHNAPNAEPSAAFSAARASPEPYKSPASYDIEAAMERMRTEPPVLRKRPRPPEAAGGRKQ